MRTEFVYIGILLLILVLLTAIVWRTGEPSETSTAEDIASPSRTPTDEPATRRSEVTEVPAVPTATDILTSTRISSRTAAPLRVHADNPRYFADANGKVVYLTGSHTWTNFQDRGDIDPPPQLEYDVFLDFLDTHNHNFIRLWVWENATWAPWVEGDFYFEPMPYERTGPGTALDGKPKFDLTKFNQDYFDRMRDRVQRADERGMYTAVMLFQGFSIEKKTFDMGNPWPGHPFNGENNVNNIDGDLDGDDEGLEIHTLQNPDVTALQEAYVRKVIDTLNDMDNVLWEITNESRGQSTEWQYHMINFIQEYETTKPKQHPVGMTAQWPGGDNEDLFASRAEWISPFHEGGWRTDPPAAEGRKVIIADTDHFGYDFMLEGGSRAQRAWVWKSFTRGLNPVFMDPYLIPHEGRNAPVGDEVDPLWNPIRQAMGDTRMYAQRIDLVAMTPHGDLASSDYCLANPTVGGEYLVYMPEGGTVTVDLSGTPAELTVEWFNPETRETFNGDVVDGGHVRSFQAPFEGDAVLYLAAAGT